MYYHVDFHHFQIKNLHLILINFAVTADVRHVKKEKIKINVYLAMKELIYMLIKEMLMVNAF